MRRSAHTEAQIIGALKQVKAASPRLCVLVRREQSYNHKRVEGIYREAGLSLRCKRRKRLSRQRSPAITVWFANEEWALDFVTDALASARHVRILTVVDVFTRECLALEADTSVGSLRVLRVLDRIIAEKGSPQRIRSDNGRSSPTWNIWPGAWIGGPSCYTSGRASPSRMRTWKASTAACARNASPLVGSAICSTRGADRNLAPPLQPSTVTQRDG